ncbi:MAG: low-specificity L-threonine aldolase [Candidatus Binatus sp.]|uniref:low-specificity L-threonine aldolase n=1 Tax=Candidatus Binatus sp. TaxID=2811406 RepID=UPI0027222265|nr:low-specificity L-threonine aldolase [Candidatus Binatus sp.]MDO8431796.1 low-specificity L-threonine aldolase [Candidatus Binatus sp.]
MSKFDLIDLRSDTVSLPTPAMRDAIARAELGDDVYGEDPTVNRLERMAAALMGKEAALLVPSGTMGNLIAMLAHCARGAKAIVGAESHTNLYEAGGASALGGIVLTPIHNAESGELDLGELHRELGTPNDDHFAQPSLVVLENTHNRCGGAPVKLSHMAEVAEAAHRRGLPLHLDGARIFNAAIALETSAKEIASVADTVSFCLSKGLACPIGSILCGSKDFIARAHRARKMLGGGMRQAGIIAAAGIVALDTMIDRLVEDHQNARALAQGLALVAGLNVRSVANRTNMVVFDVDGDGQVARRFAAAMKERGVLISPREATSFRAVTHHGVARADIDRTVAIAAQAAGEVFGD